MTTAREVLFFLCPNVEYVIYGDTYDGINWLKGEIGLTEKEFNDGFAKVDAMKAKAESEAEAKRAAILERLGLTADEAKLLIG
jgi:hypothetical protein